MRKYATVSLLTQPFKPGEKSKHRPASSYRRARREQAKIVYRVQPELPHGPVMLVPGTAWADTMERKPKWSLWKRLGLTPPEPDQRVFRRSAR